ncbi:hypothetical protein KY342_04935 [Candidatus Woesearchaeota archaeon]|nr:hypothetical protein [Candidatus Woesearchaeota archaeon]
MKKIMSLLVVMVLFCSVALAQRGIHEPGTGIENSELREAARGTGQGLAAGQRVRVQEGTFTNKYGQRMMLNRQANNRIHFEVGGVSVECPICGQNVTEERFQNRTRLYANLRSGRDAEIKVMPDTASETALQRLRLRNCDENCTIELREVGAGNRTMAAYEVRAQRNSRVFGLFRARMNVQAQVDAETGEMIQVRKPWWAFLATEAE